MAAGMAQVGANKILDTLDGKTPYSLPSLFITLCTSTTSAASAGTELTTGQYGGFARVALTGSSWSGSSGGSSTYNAALDFGTASASTGTTVTGFELWDSGTLGAGNRLWYEQLATGIPVASGGGTHITFASGQIVASCSLLASGDGFSTTYINKIVDHNTGKTTFGTAPSLYLALTTTASTATTTGTDATYTGYARVLVGTSILNASSAGSVSNNTKIDFGGATAGSSTVIGWAFADAITAGNLISAGTVTSVVISNPLVPEVAASTALLTIS